MERFSRTLAVSALLILLLCCLTACNSRRSRAQTQSERDQETRERVADATMKAKEDARIAAQQLAESARQAGHEASVAAQGAKQGWDEDRGGRLDLNTASYEQLRSLGLTGTEAEHVIRHRPYKDKQDLITRGVVPQSRYDIIQDRVTVISPAEQ